MGRCLTERKRAYRHPDTIPRIVLATQEVVAQRLPMFLLRMKHGHPEDGATDIAAYRSVSRTPAGDSVARSEVARLLVCRVFSPTIVSQFWPTAGFGVDDAQLPDAP